MSVPFIAAVDVEQRLSAPKAADALAAVLLGGLDPEADPPRGVVELGRGQMLVMASAAARLPVVKLVTVGGDPQIQGAGANFADLVPHTCT